MTKRQETGIAACAAAVLAMLSVVRAQTQPAAMDIANAPIPMHILMQSPAETDTELQVICLFSSSSAKTLHGSLVETNEKLKGLLEHVRSSRLFRGELGETVLVAPPHRSIGARKLLIVGLGDAETFSPQRMQLVGEVVYAEAGRLDVAHPFFAPTILDEGVTRFTTGQISEQVVSGFLRAAEMDRVIRDAGASASRGVTALTYLAGPRYAGNTREGMEKAISTYRLERTGELQKQ
jgi:hypothetical protein